MVRKVQTQKGSAWCTMGGTRITRQSSGKNGWIRKPGVPYHKTVYKGSGTSGVLLLVPVDDWTIERGLAMTTNCEKTIAQAS
jgi:hypothetical protein